MNAMCVKDGEIYLDLRKFSQERVMAWCEQCVGPVNESWSYWKIPWGLMVIKFKDPEQITQFQLAWSNT